MHRFAKTLACLGIPAALLTACLDSTEPAPPDKVWYGLLSNSCGPADGPAISVVLDTVAYADCNSGNHPGQYSFYTEAYPSIDSIVIGKVLTYRVEVGCLGKRAACGDKTEYRLEVERMDPTRVQAAFRIEAVSRGKQTVRTGTVVMTKCRERPFCG
ncbi:MAG TPA: hypothetical protein VJ385_19910 [Fibrobacteria bacterium]|nr:hypothetical protein [Fibrobacteria bacterium]